MNLKASSYDSSTFAAVEYIAITEQHELAIRLPHYHLNISEPSTSIVAIERSLKKKQ